LLEWVYTAPRRLPEEPEALVASWPERGAGSREALTLQLVQGPVEELALETDESLVHLGGTTALTVTAKDAFGRPRPGARVSLAASRGTLSGPREVSPGVYTGTWTLPDEGPLGEAMVAATILGPEGTEPARLRVWATGGLLYAGVTDLSGLPVPRQPLLANGEERETGEDGTVLLGPLAAGTVEVVHGQWPGLRQTVHVVGEEALQVHPLEPPLARPRASQEVRVAPALPVNVRLKVEGRRVTYWVEDAAGRVLEGRQVHVWLSAGGKGLVQVQEGRSSFTVTHEGPVSVSVADVATGVTALAEVRP
ncbi:MAG TPA: Ig-like domain-containing protein, partial [Myxococcaceae bacterium]|nr:Ig-like domain-containing protein [Myxococcaceae bacterium]